MVEHEIDVIHHADWIVDVGPLAGDLGGRVLYSGPPSGLSEVKESQTRPYHFDYRGPAPRHARQPHGWLKLEGVSRNNLDNVNVSFPLGVMTAVTGVSGSGKSSLVSQALVELVAKHLGHEMTGDEEEIDPLEQFPESPVGGRISGGMEKLRRLVRVDQRPIGRTPRSNLATYTGLFDYVRQLTEDEQPVRRHLALPHVRQAGSHTSCGCGFNEGREYPEAYDDPVAERSDALESSSRLARYVREHRVERIYSCWSGDEAEPQAFERRVTPEALVAEAFFFREGELLTIDYDAA